MEKGTLETSGSVATLCFARDVFMKENFSVDTFVSEHRKHASLEKLRDDLGIHLKFLRSSMIELINKDYADFVNLSANLVGLDKFIKNISQPLEQLKQEVNDVQATVDGILQQSQEQLEKKRRIREKKVLIQHVKFVCKSVEKVERLLPPLSADGTRSWSSDQVEQLATEVNQILFYLEKCHHVKLAGEMAQRVDVVTSALQQHLETSFLRSIGTDDLAELSSVLRVCATIDRVTSMEELFRKNVVAPAFRDIVSEKVIQESGLQGVYSQVILFVSTKCQGLLNVTVGTHGMGDASTVGGYDFLSHAVWPELAMLLEMRAPLVFAAGNPDQFHSRYSSTLEFLERFEHLCRTAEAVLRLRSEPSYQSFLTKWNLPVYFQLRFQDIASQLETCLLQPLKCSKTDSGFHTSCYQVLWEQIQRCWSQNVFLAPLAHRFWKLTLQLLNRHRHWLLELVRCKSRDEKQEGKERDTSVAADSTDSLTAFRQMDIEETALLVLLSHDTDLLVEKVQSFFESVIRPKLQQQGFMCFDPLEESISEFASSLKDLQPNISKRIVSDTAKTCCHHLKLVNDIPRLYRRTNREVPTKPSNYIQLMLEPLLRLRNHVTDTLGERWNEEWTGSVLEEITQQYLTVTNDVLVSVKKMEDSLKRLKRGRDRTPLPEGAASDDDKIRLQLYLDVKCFAEKMEEIGIAQSTVPSYASLLEVVEAARSSPT